MDLPPGIDGVLGNDLVANKAVTIDYRRGQLWVSSAIDEASLTACTHAASTPAVLGFDVGTEGHLYVPGKVQGVEGFLLIDTGASVGGISMEVLDRSKDQPIVTGFAIQMMYGTFWGGYSIVDDMSVAGLGVTRLAMYAQPDDMIPAAPGGHTLGVLPYGYLRHFLVTLDFRTNMLRLAPYVGETMANGARLFGYGMSLSVNESGPVTITRLVAASPAEEAGLAVGDEVTAIGPMDPSTLAPKNRIRHVLTADPGVRSSFTVRHDGSEPRTVELAAADLFAPF